MSIHLNNCRDICSNTACRASTLALAPSKRCSLPQRQCNQPSMDVLTEIRQACLEHNVVPCISGARPSGSRQRVRSAVEQIESLTCSRHGLLCSCQHQSFHSVGEHYNVRLCKQTAQRDEISRIFQSACGSPQRDQKPNHEVNDPVSVLCHLLGHVPKVLPFLH